MVSQKYSRDSKEMARNEMEDLMETLRKLVGQGRVGKIQRGRRRGVEVEDGYSHGPHYGFKMWLRAKCRGNAMVNNMLYQIDNGQMIGDQNQKKSQQGNSIANLKYI